VLRLVSAWGVAKYAPDESKFPSLVQLQHSFAP
jgi:hypothetical protein